MNNKSTCPTEPRDRGPLADTRTVNKVVGREELAAAELFLAQQGRQQPAKIKTCTFPFSTPRRVCFTSRTLAGESDEDEKLIRALKASQFPVTFSHKPLFKPTLAKKKKD